MSTTTSIPLPPLTMQAKRIRRMVNKGYTNETICKEYGLTTAQLSGYKAAITKYNDAMKRRTKEMKTKVTRTAAPKPSVPEVTVDEHVEEESDEDTNTGTTWTEPVVVELDDLKVIHIGDVALAITPLENDSFAVSVQR